MTDKFWTHLKLKNGDKVKFVPPAPDGDRLGGVTQEERQNISNIDTKMSYFVTHTGAANGSTAILDTNNNVLSFERLKQIYLADDTFLYVISDNIIHIPAYLEQHALAFAGTYIIRGQDHIRRVIINDENVVQINDHMLELADYKAMDLSAQDWDDIDWTDEDLAKCYPDLKSVSNLAGAIKSDIAQQDKRIEALENSGECLIKYDAPDGFTWVDNPVFGKIWTNGRGKFMTSVSALDYASLPTDGVDVYIAADGSDANNGLAPSAPKKTIANALTVNGCRRIHVAGGSYEYENVTLSHDVDIIGDASNMPVFNSHRSGVEWGTTATPGLYATSSLGDSYKIFDLTTTDGWHYKKYTKVNTLTECINTEWTYYQNTSNRTYVHTPAGVVASNDTVCYTAGFYALRINGNSHKIHIRNLRFTCGGSFDSTNLFDVRGNTTGEGVFSAYNCVFDRSMPTDADGGSCLPSREDGNVIMEKCQGYYSGRDAFGYHNSDVVEINCCGAYGGNASNGANSNGSTGHHCRIIRIGCAYHDYFGRVVHDVGNDAVSLNLGVSAWHSLLPNMADFGAGQGENVKMWLDGCVSYSSDYSIEAGDGGSYACHVYKRNMQADAPEKKNAQSEIVRY